MDANRTKQINSAKIEEFYWNEKMIVYINNYIVDLSFEEACARCQEEADHEWEKSTLHG